MLAIQQSKTRRKHNQNTTKTQPKHWVQREPLIRLSRILPIKNLILIPTAFESSQIASQLDHLSETKRFVLRHCGFGPIAAAAVATEAINVHKPKRVILLGIAGAYQSAETLVKDLTVGNAYRFSSVSVDGIGVGTGEQFQSARELGWAQFSGDDRRAAINDKIELASDSPHSLLTVCAASAKPEEAQCRQIRYGASAEDMEGFAVAMACQLQDVSLEIIRGISNVAGDRDKLNWRIDDALSAAAEVLGIVLDQQVSGDQA